MLDTFWAPSLHSKYNRLVRRAVVDVGSNSVLLLVEEYDDTHWTTIYESTDVTSLGEGTKRSGVLSPEGMSRTLLALREAFMRAGELGVAQVQAAVTMAGRIARNTQDFLDAAAAQGTPVFVLSGDDEAELGFRSVATDPAFSDASRISIIDVGGQSTELTTADRVDGGWSVRFRRSYPIGTLGLLGSTLSDELPEAMARLRACAEIDDVVGLCYLPGRGGKAIVLGATGTNLVSIREGLSHWDPQRVHGAILSYEEISKETERLFGMTFKERAALVGIEPGREKTLPIGALILERFLFALREERCAVSVRGWRHALLEKGLPTA